MAHDKNTSSEYYYQGYMGKNKRYYAINNKEYPINDIYPFFAIRIDNHDKSRRHVYVFTDTRVIPPPLEMITSLLKSVITGADSVISKHENPLQFTEVSPAEFSKSNR